MARPRSRRLILLIAALLASRDPVKGQETKTPDQNQGITVLRATVRRVIVDVVVTDRAGKPVAGLKKEDFSIFDDSEPQQVLSLDFYGFSGQMDYLPPKMPVQAPNTFVNLPATPERGPLYVLLYDLVNTGQDDQIFARKQLVKFIQEKPEGTRFAIFMVSDGLHMVQGFTSDKSLLYEAINPQRSRPHVPQIFLMGDNFGRNDPGTAIVVMRYLANFLDGLSGRKNVIWVSGSFPLVLFPSDEQSATFIDDVKKTLDHLSRDQIAIYPVDVRGVSVENAHAPSGSTGGGGISSDSRGAAGSASSSGSAPAGGGSSTLSPGSAPAGGSISPAAGGVGYSMLSSSYMAEDEIARATGGRAFYSRNDVATALTEATEDGATYYTLSYAPSNREYDAKLHSIRIDLAKHGFNLAYRRAYYSVDPEAPSIPAKGLVAGVTTPPARKVGDTLYANMEHGAPIAHALLFGAHVRAVGVPAMGTAAQMAQLADEPAFFKTRRKNATVKPLAPIELQRYRIDYTVMAHQLQLGGNADPPQLEIAAAAYDRDGIMLNAVVNVATGGDSSGSTTPQPSYRVVQEIYAPTRAATIRVGVRDARTDRIGAMEVSLPLAKEADTSSTISSH